MSENEPSLSLNFVDADHLLLIFDPRKMFKRLPECTAAHQDRLMHAVLLELPSGRVVTQADWYLHDRRPYLWPFGPGKVLLRRANDLYVVDSSLNEKLLWSSPKDLLWVSVTPTGNQIIVETAQDGQTAPQLKTSSGDTSPKPTEAFVAQFLDASTLSRERTVPLNNVVNITGTSTGYVDLIHHGDIWLIRFGPNPKLRHNIARVKSQTTPEVFYGSKNTLQIGWCGSSNCDFSVSSFTLTGRRLWHQRWSRYRIFPDIVRNEDNSRFGVSTLQQTSEAAAAQSVYDPDDPLQLDPSERDVFQQDIQVFDTASGNSVFSLNVVPAVLSGQNFSLSPDGRQLAVLHGNHLELFDLPAISPEEQARYGALKTDVQDVSAMNSSAEEKDESAHEEALNTSLNARADDSRDSNATESAAQSNDETEASAAEKSPATPVGDQKPQPTVSPVLTLKVSTRAVVVDVVVTDGKEHPVKGLPQEDFELTEDGKPQSLRSFREFTGADTPAETPPDAALKSRPNIFSNEMQARDPGAVTMILFDMLNTPAQDQMYARDQLIKFLEAKPKNERLALGILSSGSSNLTLLQGFTPDDALLVAAVKSKKGRPEPPRWQGAGVEAANSVNTVAVLAQGGRASGFGNLLGALQGMQDLQHVEEADSRVSITTDSMIQLARYLSAIPGRKNLVWLSESFPIAIGIIQSVNNSAADNRNYSEKLRSLTNMLAESQVAVYPVDVRGLVAGGFEASSTGSMISPPPLDPSTVGPAKVLAPTPQTPQGLGDLDELVSERSTLADVASATGGKAFFSANDIHAAITTALEQGSNYYTLSYTSTNRIYNRKFRKIKVALAQKPKGYSLHYRQGYFAEPENSKAPDSDLARSTRMMAMQHASPPSRQILFSATVVPTGKKTMNHTAIGEVIPVLTKKPILPALVDTQHYAIDYLLDGSAVHFVAEQNGTYRSILTLMAASFNNQGTMLTGVSHVGISNLQPSVYKDAIGGRLLLHEEAYVPLQAAWLRLGIQDQMSGHIGTIEIPLPVPAPPNFPRSARQRLPEIEKD